MPPKNGGSGGSGGAPDRFPLSHWHQCFVDARAHFDGRLLRESAPHKQELEPAVRSREALVDITLSVVSDTRSVTVFAGGLGLFVRDTAPRGFRAINGLEEIGKAYGRRAVPGPIASR